MKKDSVHSFSTGIVRFHIPSGLIATFLLTCLLKFALERPVAMKKKKKTFLSTTYMITLVKLDHIPALCHNTYPYYAFTIHVSYS